MTKEEKYKAIIDTRINGNITDFNKQVRALSKYELIQLIEYVRSGWYGDYPKLHNLLTWLDLAFL